MSPCEIACASKSDPLCNFIPSCNFVPSCKFDSYPLSVYKGSLYDRILIFALDQLFFDHFPLFTFVFKYKNF